MLRRLELVGFKSFADKTRFDFPPGITAVVGPNGSGKSNIVDAVRWILGEQSAKSLRGGEMADVIFNGSATRKSLGMAEVTLTFDNARRALAADADEVQFTRRVYRDGQGEYLINNQPARLKDIKEMFLGSGAGTSAYCIIEQGRVDALLQASTRDRRVIFEEAAGISRFRAKKLESARKLERVAQNLLRLRDILAEVDKQLRKVRLEASKAQKYQEFTRRLKDLRVGLALREYHELTGRLTAERAALEELRARLSDAAAQAQEWDAQSRELEGRLAATEEALREGEALLAEARQRIAAQRSAWVHEGQRAAELETELAAARRRRAALGYQIRDLLAEADRARASAGEVAQQVRAQEETAAALEAALAEASGELRRLREEVEAARAGHMDAVRQEALLKNEAGNARRLLDELAAKRDRAARRIEQTHGELESLALVLRDLTQTGEDLRNRLLGTRQALAERTKLRAELRRQADGVQQFLTDLHIQRGALQSRIAVLEELENSQEGIGTGVREVMAILHAERARPAAGGEPRLGDVVLGLLADFLTVPPEHAPLIDLALGEELAQCFLVTEPDRLDDLLRRRGGTFPGRVRFLPLSRGRPFLPGPMPEAFAEYPTADRLVACAEPRLADLPARLLGGTLLVPDLPAARRLAAQAPPGSPYRFLTPRGELLESDGTLTVGAHRGEGGIVSRKSELRELRREALALDERVGRLEADLLRLREQAEALEVPIRSLEEALAALTAEAGDLSTQTALHRNRHEDLCAELEQGEADLAALEQELARQREELARLEAQAAAAEAAAGKLHARIGEADRSIRHWDEQRQHREEAHAAARVALARLREQLAAAQAGYRRTEAEAYQLGEEVTAIEAREGELSARLLAGTLAILGASAELAQLHAAKEAGERATAELAERRERDRARRRELAGLLHSARAEHEGQLGKVHEREMSVRDLEKSRDVLADRLREDYQVELAELYAESQRNAVGPLPEGETPAGDTGPSSPEAGESGPAPAAALSADEAHREIDELRRKLSRLGSVNLEALEELSEVESRARDLQAQHDDLAAAQASLQEIIARINSDSRRLFSETFEAIRGHFRELFRKLFGGGMADVVLEDPADVLESGIEIVARPPGKELRSISLMSGGEKTLTAVALLLAIFRSKPSPFCLLDEVDAALDEANTNRLAGVLKEFAAQSQFIVITHKKRTMAAADVLYGITMQESGVSKQVAVRFEDWEEEPEVARAA